MLHWAKHSVAFLHTVVKVPARPFWKSWLQHVSYLEVALQYDFSKASIRTLDQAVYQHQKIFNSTPQYAGLFKPKHIFAQQYPVDVIRNGPL
eukprot:2527634-Pleurochrysis_carterae.AAC.1